MGVLNSRLPKEREEINNIRAIQDIYSMFEQSNRILITASPKKTVLTKSRIKNIQNLIQELLQPFAVNQQYKWGQQICSRFKKHFTHKFQAIWSINREQFYELLLINCNVSMEQAKKYKQKGESYQIYFYQIVAAKLDMPIIDSFVGQLCQEDKHRDYLNASILKQEQGHINESQQDQSDDLLPLMMPLNQTKSKQQYLKQISSGSNHLNLTNTKEEYLGRLRLQNSSILLPQTVFVDRVSIQEKSQLSNLLQYYKRFTNTIRQIFYSNNLISCPLKNFIFCMQEKISRKKIKLTGEIEQELLSCTEQGRKLRKRRQMNNNLILYEIKYFLEAYNEFVWMYLQLHFMSQSKLGRIINSDILYGIIFKCLWSFVDWIAERGYEFEQYKLQQYYQQQNIKYQAKISQHAKREAAQLLNGLRGEKQPQQYLKKVVVFYREVSKHCQNADDLLCIYEQTIARLIKEKGGKDLGIFRMRNIIQKLLKIQQNSMSGGQISYSWATWCILIELLRQKVNFKYGGIIIYKMKIERKYSEPESQTTENIKQFQQNIEMVNQ